MKIVLERKVVEEAIRKSANPDEAAKKLGTSRVSVYRVMKGLGIRPPSTWMARRLEALKTIVRQIPDPVIAQTKDRAWVAGLIGGEGSLRAAYNGDQDTTHLRIGLNMTDPAWIFGFSDRCGLPRPSKARPPAKGSKRNVWVKHISGLRALRVTREILPFLVGNKKKEAERAMTFFSPDGFRRGRFTGFDIWPSAEFPLRIRRNSQESYSELRKERD